MSERRPATTFGELDIHLGHIQDNIASLATAVNNMATRDDIAKLTTRIELMATKEELRATEIRLAQDGVKSTFETWAHWITRAGAVAAVVYSAVSLIQHFGK